MHPSPLTRALAASDNSALLVTTWRRASLIVYGRVDASTPLRQRPLVACLQPVVGERGPPYRWGWKSGRCSVLYSADEPSLVVTLLDR